MPDLPQGLDMRQNRSDPIVWDLIIAYRPYTVKFFSHERGRRHSLFVCAHLQNVDIGIWLAAGTADPAGDNSLNKVLQGSTWEISLLGAQPSLKIDNIALLLI